MIEYIDKIETEFKNTLACLLVAQMGSNHEMKKTRGSRDTLPLTIIVLHLHTLSRTVHSQYKLQMYVRIS